MIDLKKIFLGNLWKFSLFPVSFMVYCPGSFTSATTSLYEAFAISTRNLCPCDVIIKPVFSLVCFDLLLFQCPMQLIEPGVVTSTSVIVKTHYSFIITIKVGSQELCRFVVKRAPLLLDFILVQNLMINNYGLS